jgi:phosphatidylglycerol:prolipoprotein diacylglycerol transferase
LTKYKILATIVFLACLGTILSQIFSGRIILPQSFALGPLTIHYYGIIMAAAVFAAFYLAIKRSKDFKIDEKMAEDILFWTIVGGFIGARLYHVLSSIGYYSGHTIDIFKVWNGGLSIYGAVFGGIISIWVIKKTFNLKPSILNLLDWLAPSVLLGQIIGRFGNLFNYEAFGYPTNLPWRMFVPLDFRPVDYIKFNFFHPFFLYELLGNALILFLLIKIFEPRQNKNYAGELVFLYLLLYNSLRFGLEFLRIDSTFIGFVRLNAAMSLLLALLSLAGLLYVRKFSKTS